MERDDERPSVPLDEDAEELEARCRDDRAALKPKETAECAGIELVLEYENEEDGGS